MTARLIRPLILFLTLLALPLSAQSESAAWRVVEELWYTIEIDGVRAGYASSLTFDDGDRYRTDSEQMLRIGRGRNDDVTIRLATRFIETHTGDPVEIEFTQKLARETTHVRWSFEGGKVIQSTSRQNGQEPVIESIDAPAGIWLTPREITRYEAKRRRAGAREIKYRTADVTSGLQPVGIHMQRGGEATATLNGREIPVSVWTVTRTPESGTLSQSTVQISEDDVMVRAEESLGAMQFTLHLATKDEARRRIENAPEILVDSFVHPDRPIRAPERTTTATYRLRAKEGDLNELPSAGAQRFAWDEPGRSGVVSINLNDPVAVDESDAANPAYLAASLMIDADDPLIVEMSGSVREAAGTRSAARAEALRRAVFRHITDKGLRTAFATASETVRSRRGDCSEHALLLCTLLRAEKIPARIATGLIYADSFAGESDIFGWHMWTQALIDDRWIDLDATMDRPFSAAHILITTTALADGALADEFAEILHLMGNLEIDVIEVGYPDE